MYSQYAPECTICRSSRCPLFDPNTTSRSYKGIHACTHARYEESCLSQQELTRIFGVPRPKQDTWTRIIGMRKTCGIEKQLKEPAGRCKVQDARQNTSARCGMQDSRCSKGAFSQQSSVSLSSSDASSKPLALLPGTISAQHQPRDMRGDISQPAEHVPDFGGSSPAPLFQLVIIVLDVISLPSAVGFSINCTYTAERWRRRLTEQR